MDHCRKLTLITENLFICYNEVWFRELKNEIKKNNKN